MTDWKAAFLRAINPRRHLFDESFGGVSVEVGSGFVTSDLATYLTSPEGQRYLADLARVQAAWQQNNPPKPPAADIALPEEAA